MQTCYLNNAATTFPKPIEVINAINDFLLNGGANSSRGSSSERDLKTMNIILDCRFEIAELFNSYENCNPLLVTFCMNITEAINIVLRGFLKPNMRVLTTSMEHNAVMRPLRALEKSGVIVNVVKANSEGEINPLDVKNEFENNNFDLMIMSHASNICGTIQPLNEIASLCKNFNVPLVLDTAQTAGVININVSELNLAAMCFTGHKGLMGPQGTGGIIWNPDFAAKVTPIITGGTGSYSHLEYQPEDLPDKFESGTPNLPGIAGLNAALKWLKKTGIKNIAQKENDLGEYFISRLKNLPVKIAGKLNMSNRLPVFSFNLENIDNGTLADKLSQAGFETRPGLHCAPSAHKTLNTFPQGALRVSPGYFNTFDELDRFFHALKN